VGKIILKKKAINRELYRGIIAKYRIDPYLSALLVQNGWKIDEVKYVLAPNKYWDIEPFHIYGVKEAVQVIISAVRRKEKIALYGDYDADGITSSAIMFLLLRKLGGNVVAYLPDRFKDGYGIQNYHIERMYKEGISLLIVLDNGTTAFSPMELAKKFGIKTIIIDHHLPVDDKLPDVDVIINPWQKNCQSDFKSISTSGLAYRVVLGVNKVLGDIFNEEFMNYLLSLSAIGIIADVMPLRSENWLVVKKALSVINSVDYPGLRAIKEVAGIRDIDVRSIGYRISPRINVAGRIDTAKVAFNLLTTESYDEALDNAKFLDKLNIIRQNIVSKAIRVVQKEVVGDDIIVVEGRFHPGVIGLIAQGISKEYNKPAIAITDIGGEVRGSARSVEGVDIHKLFLEFEDLFERFGGHKLAGGFTLKQGKKEEFIARIRDISMDGLEEQKYIEYNGELRLSDINLKVISSLERLSPFGEGNDEPLFLLKDVLLQKINDLSPIYSVQKNGVIIKAVVRSKSLRDKIKEAKRGNILYTPFVDVFRDVRSVMLEIKEVF